MEFDGARADFRLFAATGLWCPAPAPAQPRLDLVGAVGAELVRLVVLHRRVEGAACRRELRVASGRSYGERGASNLRIRARSASTPRTHAPRTSEGRHARRGLPAPGANGLGQLGRASVSCSSPRRGRNCFLDFHPNQRHSVMRRGNATEGRLVRRVGKVYTAARLSRPHMEKQKTRTWQLQVAKNRFSEVVAESAKAPQIVTRHGEEAAVVIGIDAYRALIGKKIPTQSFTRFLLNAPKAPVGLEVARDKSSGRKVEFK